MAKKSISAIYCDDVRNEVGGKHSFMGVYFADIIFPSFPATLRKLCAHVTVKFQFEEIPKKSFEIVIFKGEADERLVAFQFNENALKNAKMPTIDPKIPPEDRLLAFQIGFEIEPFVIEAPTKIHLRAYSDGEEIKGNGLRVRLPTSEERQKFGFSPEQPETP